MASSSATTTVCPAPASVEIAVERSRCARRGRCCPRAGRGRRPRPRGGRRRSSRRTRERGAPAGTTHSTGRRSGPGAAGRLVECSAAVRSCEQRRPRYQGVAAERSRTLSPRSAETGKQTAAGSFSPAAKVVYSCSTRANAPCGSTGRSILLTARTIRGTPSSDRRTMSRRTGVREAEPASTTTRLRSAFEAAAKTPRGSRS